MVKKIIVFILQLAWMASWILLLADESDRALTDFCMEKCLGIAILCAGAAIIIHNDKIKTKSYE